MFKYVFCFIGMVLLMLFAQIKVTAASTVGYGGTTDLESHEELPPQSIFVQITANAITLENTKSWDTAVGNESIALFGNDPTVMNYIHGMRKLLEEDMGGMSRISLAIFN